MGRDESCHHAEAKLDPVIRAETTYRIGEQHIPEVRCHLLLVNCAGCHSTLAVPLAGHETGEWEDTTELTDVTETTSCPLTEERDPRNREGYVGVSA